MIANREENWQTFEAGKIADRAAHIHEFRAGLRSWLDILETPTHYSGQDGDRIAQFSNWLSDQVGHYVVSCGQVMTRQQAEYVGRIK